MPSDRPLVHAPSAIEPALEQLLTWLADEVNAGATFADGEFVQVGWATFRVEAKGGTPRLTAPLPGVLPMQFVDDCSDALNLFARQRFLLESFDLEAQWCSCTQAALALKDLASCDEWFLERVGEEDGLQSGWRFGALDSALDAEDPANLEFVSLWELCCRNPEVAPFLLLPTGWQVSFEHRPAVLRDRVEVAPRPGSFFAARYGT